MSERVYNEDERKCLAKLNELKSKYVNVSGHREEGSPLDEYNKKVLRIKAASYGDPESWGCGWPEEETDYNLLATVLRQKESFTCAKALKKLDRVSGFYAELCGLNHEDILLEQEFLLKASLGGKNENFLYDPLTNSITDILLDNITRKNRVLVSALSRSLSNK